jgi:hypothetical protein
MSVFNHFETLQSARSALVNVIRVLLPYRPDRHRFARSLEMTAQRKGRTPAHWSGRVANAPYSARSAVLGSARVARSAGAAAAVSATTSMIPLTAT